MKRDMTETHKWNAADTVTSVRIAASLLLLFLTPKSRGFFAVYTLTGLTDVLDGWLARRTGTASGFGARLDSIADLLFYSVVLIRFLPVLRQALPGEIWYAVAAIKYHHFASLHTRLNKLTGAAIFLLPYVLAVSTGVGYSWAVCILAFVASLEELIIHLCRPACRADRKSALE